MNTLNIVKTIRLKEVKDERPESRVGPVRQDNLSSRDNSQIVTLPYEKNGKFSVIYADPPWNVDNQRSSKSAGNHYQLMSLERIQKLPVGKLASRNAACFLWVCNGMFGKGEETLSAWGFTPVSDFVWVKPRIGMGGYFRYASERLLLGVRGKMPPAFKSQPSWGFFPVQDHSHKPEELYSIIERMYPNTSRREGYYLELFARRRPPNKDWYIWGNEAPGGSDIVIPGYPVPNYSGRARNDNFNNCHNGNSDHDDNFNHNDNSNQKET